MKDYFIRQFEYNRWANESFVKVFVSRPDYYKGYVAAQYSHVINAMFIWYERVAAALGMAIMPSPGIFEWIDEDKLKDLSFDASHEWLSLLDDLTDEDFSRVIRYNNLKGEPQSSTLTDILAHVVNHSSYHRGQIAKALREAGAIPPVTDYIAYARQH